MARLQKYQNEDSLHCFCKMLLTAGKALETEHAKARKDEEPPTAGEQETGREWAAELQNMKAGICPKDSSSGSLNNAPDPHTENARRPLRTSLMLQTCAMKIKKRLSVEVSALLQVQI